MLSDIDLPKLPDGYRWKFYKSKASGNEILAIQKKRAGLWFNEEISFPSVYTYGNTIEQSIQSAARNAMRRFNNDMSRYYGTQP